MYYGLPLDRIHVLFHEFIPYIGTLSTQKLVTLHCAKVGGGENQGPATQVTMEIFMYYGLPLDRIHVLLHEFMPYIGTLSTQKL